MRLLRSLDDLYRSFVADTEEDVSSPTTSVFANRVGRYRQAVQELSENPDDDVEALNKFRKSIKALLNEQQECVRVEENLAECLCNLAVLSNPGACRTECDAAVSMAWMKFSVLFKDLAEATKVYLRNSQNCVATPLSSLVKADSRTNKVSLKQVDKAFRDYQTKFAKLEKEARNQSGADVYKLSQVDLSESLLRERTVLQYELCRLFLKSSRVQSKGGVNLLQAIVELYHTMTNYLRKSLQIMEDLAGYVDELSESLGEMKTTQATDQRAMQALCKSLKKLPVLDDYDAAKTDDSFGSSDSLSVTVMDSYSSESTPSTSQFKSGYLLKRSKRRMNRNWYRRRCEVRQGLFCIWHDNESLSPIQINLLTCQIFPSRDDGKVFVVHSQDRKYEFQADSEAVAAEWISFLNNMRKVAERETMCNEAVSGEHIQKLAITRIIGLPGNDVCCDCGSSKDITWLCTNFGSLHCIDCAGVHRDLGVHVSRIQSLSLDRLDRATALIPLALGNQKVNTVLEATFSGAKRLATVTERKRFIQAKYVQRKFVSVVTDRPMEYLIETVAQGSVSNLLHLFASGVNLNTTIDPSTGDTVLIASVCADRDGSHMAFIQFLLQNGADVNGANSCRETALHVCVRYNKPECLKLLLMTWNVDVESQNDSGLTALQMAKQLQCEACLRLLLRFNDNSRVMFADVDVPLSLLNDSFDEPVEHVPETPVRHYSMLRARSLPFSHSGATSLTESVFREPQNVPKTIFDYRLSALPTVQCKSFTLAKMESTPDCKERSVVGDQKGRFVLDGPPQPAPRKTKPNTPLLRKCRALYSCQADNPDEISFSKGDEILITNEALSDENDCWMEGYVVGGSQRVGRFPTSFVTFI